MAAPLAAAWFNGRLLPLEQVRISPLDRGFLFGDAVYEMVPVYGGRPLRWPQHRERLERSLAAIGIASPCAADEWTRLLEQLVAANGGGDMGVYFQITRGVPANRDHAFPAAAEPTVFAMCVPLPPRGRAPHREGVAAITAEDSRWARCDIKATSLLPNVLARQQAAEAGALETILVRDGQVTEGAAMSVFAVIDGELRTPPNGPQILPGVTRDLVLELAARNGIAHRVAPISIGELRGADEVWLSSSTKEVVPVTQLDGARIGDGRPGKLWRRMDELYAQFRDAEAAGA